MLDFDSGKLLIIGVVALVVIGPKDLPRVLRQAGQMMGRVRRMAGEFQGQFMEAVKEAELQDLREEVAKIQDTVRLDVDFDPARDVRQELMTAVEGKPQLEPATVGEVEAPPLPRASKTFPSLDYAPAPSVAAAEIGPVVADLPAESLTSGTAEAAVKADPVPGSTVEPDPSPEVAIEMPAPAASADALVAKEPRRKILVSRHHSLSRPQNPRERAPLPYRSRNILPARLGTPPR